MTNHGEYTFPWPTAMDIPVAGTHWACRGPQIGADRIEEWFAKGESACSIPNQGRKNVALAQSQADRNAQRFLTAPKKHTAMDLSHAIKAGKFLIQYASQEHKAKGLDVTIMR